MNDVSNRETGNGHTGRQRARGWTAIAAVAVGALAVGVAGAAAGAFSVGEVIPGGDEPTPPPENRLAVDETVLATGVSEVGGNWRMTAYRGGDSDSRDSTLPCVRMTFVEPPEGTVLAGTGFCGRPGKSGVMAVSLPVRDRSGATELTILGLAPPEAASVELAQDGQSAVRVPARPSASSMIDSDVWAMTVPDGVDGGTLRWLDEDGNVTTTDVDTTGFFDRLEAIEKIGRQAGG